MSNDALTVFHLGVTTVTSSATDSAGNTGTAQATVTVISLDLGFLLLQSFNLGNS